MHEKFTNYLLMLKSALSIIKSFCCSFNYKPVHTDHQSKSLYCQDCRLLCLHSNKFYSVDFLLYHRTLKI